MNIILFLSFLFVIPSKNSEICSSDPKIRQMITPLLKPLSEAFHDLYNMQKSTPILIKHRKEEFFGMRDFYRWVKKFCLLCFHDVNKTTQYVCLYEATETCSW